MQLIGKYHCLGYTLFFFSEGLQNVSVFLSLFLVCYTFALPENDFV